MTNAPEIELLSLFVPNLDAASRRYAAVLGIQPEPQPGPAPHPPPFAAKGPVVFRLGPVTLALYQAAPGRGTHPGDVGIGLTVEGSVRDIAARASAQGGKVFFGPAPVPEDGREMAVFVLPDRHFFELLTKGRARPHSDENRT